jgi:hypothetical protein
MFAVKDRKAEQGAGGQLEEGLKGSTDFAGIHFLFVILVYFSCCTGSVDVTLKCPS